MSLSYLWPRPIAKTLQPPSPIQGFKAVLKADVSKLRFTPSDHVVKKKFFGK